jgi:hypothetical protein
MKKMNFLTMILSVAVVVSLIVVTACTKEGPQGPPGEDGMDGNATCGACHDNSETIEIISAQWGHSIHAIGGHNFENRTTCAPCHTSQGFKEVVNTDTTATLVAVQNPANINCYTCHKIHDTYATADFELRKTTPIKFWLTGETVDLGAGNICAQCHQPRTSYAIPDVNNPNGDYVISSSQRRFGPHYGSQGATISGTAYYLVGGGYSNSSHLGIDNTCVTCHMGDAIGYTAGGHSFNIYDGEEGAWVTSGCAPCHTADEAVDLIEGFQPEIEALVEELGTLLVAKGIYNPEGTSGTAVPGTYTNDVAGAYWNYKSVTEDRSGGVHNPKFVKRILEQSISVLQ